MTISEAIRRRFMGASGIEILCPIPDPGIKIQTQVNLAITRNQMFISSPLSSSWDFQDPSFVLDGNNTALDDNLPLNFRNPEHQIIFAGRDRYFK